MAHQGPPEAPAPPPSDDAGNGQSVEGPGPEHASPQPDAMGGGPAATPPPPWGRPPQQQSWSQIPGQPANGTQPYAVASAPRRRVPIGWIVGCVVLLIVGVIGCCAIGSWYFARQAGGMVGLTAAGWYMNVVQGSYGAVAELTVGGEAEAKRLAERISQQFGHLVPTGQEMIGVKPRLSPDGKSADVPLTISGSKGRGVLVIHMKPAAGGLWQVEDVSFEEFQAY